MAKALYLYIHFPNLCFLTPYKSVTCIRFGKEYFSKGNNFAICLRSSIILTLKYYWYVETETCVPTGIKLARKWKTEKKFDGFLQNISSGIWFYPSTMSGVWVEVRLRTLLLPGDRCVDSVCYVMVWGLTYHIVVNVKTK